jgi:hypothetical protein
MTIAKPRDWLRFLMQPSVMRNWPPRREFLTCPSLKSFALQPSSLHTISAVVRVTRVHDRNSPPSDSLFTVLFLKVYLTNVRPSYLHVSFPVCFFYAFFSFVHAVCIGSEGGALGFTS